MFTNLSDINRSNRSWNYESGITLENPTYTKSVELTSETFAKQFYENFPSLKNMNWNNIVIMGGSVLSLLFNSPIKDLDFFIVGLDRENTLKRAEEFLNFIKDVEKQYTMKLNEDERLKHKNYHNSWSIGNYTPRTIDIQAVRNGSVISIYLSAIKCPIQLVLLTCTSKEELVKSCDFAVNATHFDGNDVWLTKDGLWEIENMSVQIKQAPYPPIYRIVKMFHKKFSIILHEGDPSKLDYSTLKKARVLGTSETQLDLFPSFGLKYTAVHGGKVMTEDIIPLDNDDDLMKEEVSPPAGRYTPAVYTSNRRVDSKTILYNNLVYISRLSGPEDNLDFVVAGIDDNICNVLKRWPSITERQVTNCYNNSMVKDIYGGQTLNFSTMRRFLHDLNVFEFFEKLKAGDKLTPDSDAICDELSKEVERHATNIRSILPSLIEKYGDLMAPVCTVEEISSSNYSINDADKFYGDKKRKLA